MWWLRKEHPRAGRKALKDVWIERTYDYVVANGSLKGKILQMEVVEDFESRPHKAVSFCGRKIERNKGMERAGAAEGAAWSQRRKVATKEKGREEGVVDEDGGRKEDQRPNRPRSGCRYQGEGKRARWCQGCCAKTSWESVVRRWDCSQIENEEDEESWREGDQMAAQWEEEQSMEEIMERRRIEGETLKL